jgi:hypothetical protein
MGNGLLLHTYKGQVQDLSVFVESYSRDAVEVATLVVENRDLLATGRRQLDLLEALGRGNRAAMSDLDTALGILEQGGEVGEELVQRLHPALPLTIDAQLLLPDSLALNGVVHSSDGLLEELLSENELADVRRHLQRPVFERLKWTTGDYIALAAAVLTGLAVDMLNMAWRVNSPIDKDGVLRDWFEKKLHNHSNNNPIDYQGRGFGGKSHRVRSWGHDLSRFLEAVKQTAEGEFRGKSWSYSKPIEVISKANQHGNPYPQMSWFAAFQNVVIHLFADFFSAHSLPLPLSSVVYENCGREMRKFVHELYGNGYNLRHIALNSVEVLLACLVIEVWLWLQYGLEQTQEPAVKLKKYEMRAAAMGFLSGANIGGCLLFENPFLLNIPLLIAAVDSAVRMYVLDMKRHSELRKGTRSIQDLLTSWSQLQVAMEEH